MLWLNGMNDLKLIQIFMIPLEFLLTKLNLYLPKKKHWKLSTEMQFHSRWNCFCRNVYIFFQTNLLSLHTSNVRIMSYSTFVHWNAIVVHHYGEISIFSLCFELNVSLFEWSNIITISLSLLSLWVFLLLTKACIHSFNDTASLYLIVISQIILSKKSWISHWNVYFWSAMNKYSKYFTLQLFFWVASSCDGRCLEIDCTAALTHKMRLNSLQKVIWNLDICHHDFVECAQSQSNHAKVLMNQTFDTCFIRFK